MISTNKTLLCKLFTQQRGSIYQNEQIAGIQLFSAKDADKRAKFPLLCCCSIDIWEIAQTITTFEHKLTSQMQTFNCTRPNINCWRTNNRCFCYLHKSTILTPHSSTFIYTVLLGTIPQILHNKNLCHTIYLRGIISNVACR